MLVRTMNAPGAYEKQAAARFGMSLMTNGNIRPHRRVRMKTLYFGRIAQRRPCVPLAANLKYNTLKQRKKCSAPGSLARPMLIRRQARKQN